MRHLPTRQIHLDFHTSPHIAGVGADFDGALFAKTLKDAHVEWINLFAKCHHGMFYYKTELGTVHPHLSTELLKGQIEACRKEGIKCGIYTCVGWSEDTADRNPEWMEVSADGVVGVKKPFTAAYSSWQKLCINNREHRAAIKTELKEEFELFRPDGFWIDIIFQNKCLCKTCMAEMLDMGLDPEDAGDVFKHDRMVQISFMRDVHAHIRTLSGDVHIYFNCNPYEMDLADDMGIAGRNKQDLCTYIDIESLPSDAWGYSHFPVAVNYVNKGGKDINMMNGKFHTSWGDFGSLRNKAALEYECFRAAANGAGVCVGDQLHPRGRLDPSAYKRIGEVFASLKEKAPWCDGTQKLSQIGVYATRRSGEPAGGSTDTGLADEGAYRVLSELKYTFDYVDLTDDISGFELVVLPDRVHLDAAAADRLNAYIRNGGKALITANSAVDHQRGFLVDGIGAEYRGPAPYCPRYMRITEAHFPGIPPMDYVAYMQGADVAALEGTQVLARAVDPYFNRGYYKFSSHRQTPPDCEAPGSAAITLRGGVAYIANPLFSDYASSRCMVYRDIIEQLIADLGVRPIVEADLPSFVEVTVRKKGDSTIVHLLNYIIERKSRRLDTIEETAPLYNRTLSVECPQRPARVTVVPDMKELALDYSDGRATFTMDIIRGHEIIEIA
ncbi:MAG: beta-galactosidase trimerization domain-containing protein [Oscillospiraceae bacterium]|nr:beta-galactosidase trimerization domain-containing protein [Oscillospiraceae bacterium]